MNELVFLKNNEAMTDSLTVAENFHKRHDRVLRAVDELTFNLPKNGAVYFTESNYKDAKGENRRMYLMNRDGFSLLVMGFTGKKALDWKLKYIEAFNAMETFIKEKSTKDWIETRKQGKLTRKAETDTIKRLIEYAKEQGSTHADMLYMTYSKLANRMAGIESRDMATIMQLNNLSLMENVILHVIDTGILMGTHYKQIYQNSKSRLEQFRDVAFIEG